MFGTPKYVSKCWSWFQQNAHTGVREGVRQLARPIPVLRVRVPAHPFVGPGDDLSLRVDVFRAPQKRFEGLVVTTHIGTVDTLLNNPSPTVIAHRRHPLDRRSAGTRLALSGPRARHCGPIVAVRRYVLVSGRETWR